MNPLEAVAAATTFPNSVGMIPQLSSSLQAAVAFQVPAQLPAWRMWLATLTDVATVIIALALLVTVFILLLIALQVRKLLRKVDPLLKQVRSHIDPVMGHVRDVGENVNYMSSAIRADVQHVSELVDTTRRRLTRSADAAEHRIREFNALLGMMQEEAERLFVDTASTVRGVQAGRDAYRSLQTNGGRSRAGAPPGTTRPEP